MLPFREDRMLQIILPVKMQLMRKFERSEAGLTRHCAFATAGEAVRGARSVRKLPAVMLWNGFLGMRIVFLVFQNVSF